MGKFICNILFGISGTLKRTTMDSGMFNNYFKVYSDNKLFFELDEMYFNWSARVNDAHLAIHRLLLLSTKNYLPTNQDIVIERGVTDNLFFVPSRKIPGLESYDNMKINELSSIEYDYIINRSGVTKIDKTLLIMEDKEFIENKVLKDRYRRAVLPTVDDYLRKQEEYIKFTEDHNTITKEIVISNAREYLNLIGVEYNDNL